jgi:16S rRNA G966 N2-methylase RsmD
MWMGRLNRYWRLVKYSCVWLFLEKPRGLDFHMRKKSLMLNGTGNTGYALSPQDVVKGMLNKINISPNDSFIDIGCGKGSVLHDASKYNFRRIAGVEIDESLVNTARKNFQRLDLADRIEVYQCDATKFDKYPEFNIFYFFNPFALDVYKKVLLRIFDAIQANQIEPKDRIYLLCYGVSDTATIVDSGMFSLLDSYSETERGGDINIWKYNCHAID